MYTFSPRKTCLTKWKSLKCILVCYINIFFKYLFFFFLVQNSELKEPGSKLPHKRKHSSIEAIWGMKQLTFRMVGLNNQHSNHFFHLHFRKVRMMKIFSTHLFHSSPLLLMTSYKNHIHTYTYIHIYTHMHTNTFIHTRTYTHITLK